MICYFRANCRYCSRCQEFRLVGRDNLFDLLEERDTDLGWVPYLEYAVILDIMVGNFVCPVCLYKKAGYKLEEEVYCEPRQDN